MLEILLDMSRSGIWLAITVSVYVAWHRTHVPGLRAGFIACAVYTLVQIAHSVVDLYVEDGRVYVVALDNLSSLALFVILHRIWMFWCEIGNHAEKTLRDAQLQDAQRNGTPRWTGSSVHSAPSA